MIGGAHIFLSWLTNFDKTRRHTNKIKQIPTTKKDKKTGTEINTSCYIVPFEYGALRKMQSKMKPVLSQKQS